MIQDVEISNFKCFKSLHLPDLSRVNIVSGKNNVGKTALLEALFIFHDRAHPEMFLKTLGWRGILSVPVDPASLWAPFFHNLDLAEPIEIRLKIDGQTARARYELNPRYSPASRASSARDQAPQHVNTSEENGSRQCLDISYTDPGGREVRQHLYVSGDAKHHLEGEDEPDPLERTMILPARRREDPKTEAGRLSRLIEEKNEGLVEDFLSIMAPVSDLQISHAGALPAIICDVGLPRLVPVGYVGDGMTRLLTVLLAMADVRDGVLLIDEVENGVHYTVQTAFWAAIARAAEEFGCQVIATTHSYEFLRAAHNGLQGLFEPEFRYIRLEQNGSETSAKTFTHEMLGAALAANLEVR